jgi:hypothetical protein
MRKHLLIFYHFDLPMASISFTRIGFYLIFFFVILHTIDSFRLHDLRNEIINNQNEIQSAQSTEEHHDRTRSVLWPKICIAMLQDFHHRGLRNGTNKHFSRKCYPFDMR